MRLNVLELCSSQFIELSLNFRLEFLVDSDLMGDFILFGLDLPQLYFVLLQLNRLLIQGHLGGFEHVAQSLELVVKRLLALSQALKLLDFVPLLYFINQVLDLLCTLLAALHHILLHLFLLFDELFS